VSVFAYYREGFRLGTDFALGVLSSREYSDQRMLPVLFLCIVSSNFQLTCQNLMTKEDKLTKNKNKKKRLHIIACAVEFIYKSPFLSLYKETREWKRIGFLNPECS
jgi:hypothetical protein